MKDELSSLSLFSLRENSMREGLGRRFDCDP